MPMTWDNAADAKLFAAVVATADPKFDYQKLATIMGPECTAKAITHRITKLREIAKTFDTSALATQSPAKRVRTPKAKAAQRNGEDDDSDESPTKKQKTTTIPKKTAKKGKPEREVKEEGEGEKSMVKAEESANDG